MGPSSCPALSVCLSCLSVILVYSVQTVGRIKIKLGMLVGLGPGHIVLDGDPAPVPPKGHSPPIFSPYLLSQSGWMDQDATWYGGRPRPRPHCARQGPSPQEKGAQLYPIFGPYLLSRNGWMDQDATWYWGKPRPRPHCARWGPSSPTPKGHTPNFLPISIVAKRLDGSRCHLVRR